MAKFVLSKNKVLEQFNKIKNFADIVSYSSKTNQDITKILEKKTDCMFSVHLINELKHIKDKSRVLFLAQGWDDKKIEKLISLGIKSFVVDNKKDLEKLVDYLKTNDVDIDFLLLRLKLKEKTIRTERYFVFGMGSDMINKKIKSLKKNKNIRKLGIHFHRKTQNMSEWNLKYEFSNVIEKETIDIIDVVNIGGGIPSVYANTNENVIKTVFNKIKEFKDWLNKKNIKVIIEPGRFIAAPSVKLITKIINIYENNIIVDASVYNSDMDALIVPVKLLVKDELDKDKGQPYIIKGKTPCSMDIFRYRVYLDNPKIRDKLTFLNAGAYNFSSDFCDLKKLETKVIE